MAMPGTTGRGVVRSMSASISLMSSVKPFGRDCSAAMVAWNFASFLARCRWTSRRATRSVKQRTTAAAMLTIRYR